MVILSGLNPLPISEKLEAERGIYRGQDYHLYVKDLPLYLFTGYTFDAALYQASDESIAFPVSVVKVNESGDQFLSILVPESITETFTMGNHYLLRMNVTNDSTSEYTRIANLCCVCYS